MQQDSGNILGLLRLALWPPATFPGFDILVVVKSCNRVDWD